MPCLQLGVRMGWLERKAASSRAQPKIRTGQMRQRAEWVKKQRELRAPYHHEIMVCNVAEIYVRSSNPSWQPDL